MKNEYLPPQNLPTIQYVQGTYTLDSTDLSSSPSVAVLLPHISSVGILLVHVLNDVAPANKTTIRQASVTMVTWQIIEVCYGGIVQCQVAVAGKNFILVN